MNDKLSQQIRKAEDEAADEQVSATIAAHEQEKRDRALMLVGGFQVATKIVEAVDTEKMRGLERFGEMELYKSLGFQTMVEFLNSDLSPLTKAQYYERKALLEKEGDKLFDLYGNIGLSVRRRKLLGAGSVELEGDTVIIHKDGEEISIDITERSRLLETVTALADANADKSRKLENQAQKISKHDSEKRDLYDELDRERARKRAEVNDDPHSHAIVNLTFAFQNLESAIGDMSEIEKQQFINQDFELIAAHMQDLAASYGRDDWTTLGKRAEAATGDDIDAILTKALDEDEAALSAAM